MPSIHYFQPLIAQILWVSLASASFQQPAGFTTWFWQGSVVAKNWLYIDGGALYIDNNEVVTNYTIAVDLSQSWKNSSIPVVITKKSSSFPLARRPSLWYDATSDLVYSFGGFQFNTPINSTIWAFKPDGKGHAPWQKIVSETDQLWNSISVTFGALTAISNVSFYSFGGIEPPHPVYNGVPTVVYPGMAAFDYQSSKWTNISSSGYKPQGYGVLGEAEFIPTFGKKGTIVFVGGNAPTGPSWPYTIGSSLADMTIVNIYDVDSGNWFQQETTGDIPPGRYAFCMVGAGESGTGSYELFVYGGLSGTESGQPQSSDYFDMFLLSIPSFTWTKVNSAVLQMRASHKCQVIGNRQMLVIGGHDPSSLNFGDIPDAFSNGVGIFDMSALSWADKFEPNAKSYMRPSLINDHYANNKSSPTWNSPQVSSIFAMTTASPTLSSTTTAVPSPSHHHTSTGAIIGGTIAGIIILSLLTLSIYCLRKRWRHQRQHPRLPLQLKEKTLRSELEQPTSELEQPTSELGDGNNRWQLGTELDAAPSSSRAHHVELSAE